MKLNCNKPELIKIEYDNRKMTATFSCKHDYFVKFTTIPIYLPNKVSTIMAKKFAFAPLSARFTDRDKYLNIFIREVK